MDDYCPAHDSTNCNCPDTVARPAPVVPPRYPWMSLAGQGFRDRFRYSPEVNTLTPLGFFVAGAEWERERQRLATPTDAVPEAPRPATPVGGQG